LAVTYNNFALLLRPQANREALTGASISAGIVFFPCLPRPLFVYLNPASDPFCPQFALEMGVEPPVSLANLCWPYSKPRSVPKIEGNPVSWALQH